MGAYILLIAILIVAYIVLKGNNKNSNENKENSNIYEKFKANGYVMTQTELTFYRQLKLITDKLELTIFPQVDMERIINVSDNNIADRNKIKSKSIDFTIVSNKNCKIVCCMELDDYTHNYEKAKKNDQIKNEIFAKVNIPLHRIKVQNFYNMQELENKIKESI